ncbi:hypothetical protein L208DRAFT_1303219 [Tricholoma matsutake]|nr:hypothetical protein L208DRAFT_1303219 [Tricholoma matsutake 945]
MHCEHIHTVKSWRKGPGHYNTIFVNTDPSIEGMQGLNIARMQLFFSFSHDGVEYSCTLIHWFSCVGTLPDNNTGMWVVKPDVLGHGEAFTSIIHLDMIVQASHLILVFGPQHVSKTLSFTNTLDAFSSFYVNKYVDHHAFEIAF